MIEPARGPNHRFGIPHKDPKEIEPIPRVQSVPHSSEHRAESLSAPSLTGLRSAPVFESVYKPVISSDMAYRDAEKLADQMRAFFSQFNKQSRETISETGVTVDLSEVRMFPSILIAVLMRGCRDLQLQGGSVRVVCGAESGLYDRLRMLQLTQFATLEKLPRSPTTVDDI